MAMPAMSYTPAPDLIPIKRALLSVSDKTGLEQLAKIFTQHKIETVSTGGTAQSLRSFGLKVKDVSELTGFPEIMDGRLKTLHPLVHGGLLGRRDAHLAQMKQHQIPEIDLLVVNLYPFAATVAAGKDFATCIENIDIGGPAMLRAAAKNHDFVVALTEASDYAALAEELEKNQGATTLKFRQKMAAKAYRHTAAYDAMVSGWFSEEVGEQFPESFIFAGKLAQTLRYGENSHQQAAFYTAGNTGLASAKQLQGKELSYNNLLDADAALNLAREFGEPSVAIIKHNNPCGVASAVDLAGAYEKALASDPVSAFGGVVALNRPLDVATAEKLAKIFTEVILAPGAEEAAKTLLAKKTDLRLLIVPELSKPNYALRSIAGGFLLQTPDTAMVPPEKWQVVTKRQPTPEEKQNMLFAMKVCKHVKSNAIVFAKNGATLGIGAGQMSRIDSTRIAIAKAQETGHSLAGAAVASDAFYPFPDAMELAAKAGATAIIQPGGSKKDADVIAAADRLGVAMVTTGIRHFRH